MYLTYVIILCKLTFGKKDFSSWFKSYFDIKINLFNTLQEKSIYSNLPEIVHTQRLVDCYKMMHIVSLIIIILNSQRTGLTPEPT